MVKKMFNYITFTWAGAEVDYKSYLFSSAILEAD